MPGTQTYRFFEVRLSYFHGWEPTGTVKNPNDIKYRTAVLIPKTGKYAEHNRKAYEDMLAEIRSIAASAGIKNLDTMALRDGDSPAERPEDNPERAGHWFFNCTSTRQPGFVDKQTNPLMDRAQLYSGAYANMGVNMYLSKDKTSSAIGFQMAQALGYGEPLGGAAPAPQSVFSAIEDNPGYDASAGF